MLSPSYTEFDMDLKYQATRSTVRFISFICLRIWNLNAQKSENLSLTDLPNLALWMPSWMKSRDIIHGIASLANDGDNDTASERCAQSDVTSKERFQWWRVDLLAQKQISAIEVTSRGDCCDKTLGDFELRVAVFLNDPWAPQQLSKYEQVCAKQGPGLERGKSVQINCDDPLNGRYVTLVMTSTKFPLVICELGVFGNSLMEVKLNGDCTAKKSQCELYPAMKCEASIGSKRSYCKRDVGERCASPGDCVSSSECYNGKCYLRVGSDCNPEDGSCFNATMLCDTDKKCRLRLRVQCKNRQSLCQLGSICDATITVCVREPGKPCSEDEDCVTGADCTDGTCQCDVHLSQTQGTVCKPLKDRVGGTCDVGCIETNLLACVDNKCACAPNSAVNRHYSCQMSHGGTCIEHTDCAPYHRCNIAYEQCAPEAGQPCQTSEPKCGGGHAECINGTCRLNLDGECSVGLYKAGGPNLCSPSVFCEPEVDECKFRGGPGTSCAEEHCWAGFQCDKERNYCVVPLLNSCLGKTIIYECSSSALCDRDLKCKLRITSACSNSSDCMSGASCLEGICALKAQMDCSEFPSNCGHGFICDNTKRCRGPVGSDCKLDAVLPCASGGSCQDETCQCQKDIATLGGSRCSPKPGISGGNCSSGACTDPFAKCNVSTNTCECLKEYALDPLTLTCSRAPGESCSRQIDDCVNGSVCDMGKICKLELGQSCNIDQKLTGLCRRRTLCGQDSICRLDMHGDCSSGKQDLCAQGSSCDFFNYCRYSVGTECWPSPRLVCVAGAKCTNKTCQCDPLIAVFNNTSATCVPIAGVVGGSCDPKKGNEACVTENSVCDEDSKKCKCKDDFTANPDFTCKTGDGAFCVEDEECSWCSACDKDICSTKPGCYCPSTSSCTRDALCDFDNLCRIKIGGSCDKLKSSLCIHGAFCASNSVCEPKIPNVYGFCTNGTCDSPNSKCLEDDMCHCDEGFKFDCQLYECIQAGTDLPGLMLVIIIIVLTVVTITAIAFFVAWMVRQKPAEKPVGLMGIQADKGPDSTTPQSLSLKKPSITPEKVSHTEASKAVSDPDKKGPADPDKKGEAASESGSEIVQDKHDSDKPRPEEETSSYAEDDEKAAEGAEDKDDEPSSVSIGHDA